MDVDLLKSATEDQMEMMMMMMAQMNKSPEHYRPYHVVSELPSIEFPGDTASHLTSPTLLNSPSSISFMGTTIQQPLEPPLLSDAMTGSLRNPRELSGARTFFSSSQKLNSMAAMREMIFRIAAMQPIHIDPESVKPPKRRNVKISKDPQSVAARHRRERISEKIRILQRLVPGGTKMDTASMLDEAIHYFKFLKAQVQSLELAAANRPTDIGFSPTMSNMNFPSFAKAYQPAQIFSPTQMLS